ncbi:MAG TPA: hypothetical protein DDZ51_05575 [Planctomycetaceae bacterium]|nr:hypothetical protein [Planctomycetaceae bacterium]
MGNTLSPGCCCAACDIFRCDFDLRYILPTIPEDTSDWINVFDIISTGVDGTNRLFEISPGFPGEGLIFRQQISVSPFPPNPVFPKGRQRTIPVYQSHPDVAPFAAFPNFATLGASFHYEIRNPITAITPGFYRITGSGIFGPTNQPNLAAVIEPRWPTYWRNHFSLHDENGEVDLPVDRFPFVLRPGEYLRSLRKLPANWVAVNAIRAFHQQWANGPIDSQTIVRFESDDETVIGMRNTLETVSNTRRHVPILEIGNNDSPIVVRPRFVSSALSPLRYGYWWLFRDRSVDLSESFDATEFSDDFQSSVGAGNIAFGPSLVPTNERSRGVVNVALENAASRVVLAVANNEQRLGTITAGRMLAEPAEDPKVNKNCEPRHVCPIIYPHSHVKWQVDELTIPGLAVPEPSSYTSVECNRECDLSPVFELRPTGSFEFPTRRLGPDFYVRDETRTPRNLSLSVGPLLAGVGYYRDAISEVGKAQISGGKVRVLIDRPAATAPKIQVRVWLDLQYPTSFLPDDLLGVPGPWGGNWGDAFGNPLFDFAASGPKLLLTSQFGDNFVVDPTLPNPNPTEVEYGWSLLEGFEFGLVLSTRLLMFWERLLDPWDGPLPEIELTGADYDFETPVPIHPGVIGTHTQSQIIKVLTSSAQSITGYDSASPPRPLITTTATFEEIDLANLVLRLSPGA